MLPLWRQPDIGGGMNGFARDFTVFFLLNVAKEPENPQNHREN